MKYDKFMYLFPPRPEVKCNPDVLTTYDNGEYVAQPKYNGSCCVLFTNGADTHIFNRHKELLTGVNKDIGFEKLAQSWAWYVFCGEYLNKNKKGEDGNPFNHVFIMWDVLVWDGNYLVGTSLMKRLMLLEQYFPCYSSVISNRLESYKHICNSYIPLIYRAPTYMNRFDDLYKELIGTDLYEGLVIKKREAKLEYGFNEANNTSWQIKCRKPTKLYSF